MSFAAIIATRNGTEGSNFHIRNTMTAIVEVSGTCVSDMKIRALCPISSSNDSRKRHEMRLISKLGTVHPLGINERFSYF